MFSKLFCTPLQNIKLLSLEETSLNYPVNFSTQVPFTRAVQLAMSSWVLIISMDRDLTTTFQFLATLTAKIFFFFSFFVKTEFHASCPVGGHCELSPALSSSFPSVRSLYTFMRSYWSFPRLNSLTSLSLSSQERYCSPFIYVALHLTCFVKSTSLFYWRAQNQTWHSRSVSAEQM